MMRAAVVLALMAGPAAAECFTGQPHQVTYSDGPVMTVVDRKGDKVTQMWSSAEGETVTSHLALFTLTFAKDGRERHDTWKGRLPRLSDLVPGYKFDLSGTKTYSDGETVATRLQGEVMAPAAVTVGPCAYETTVIKQSYSVNGEWMFGSTVYLRTDMLVVLQSDTYGSGTDLMTRVATAIQ